MDYSTKWPEVFPTTDQSAATVADLLVREVVSRPGELSDRALLPDPPATTDGGWSDLGEYGTELAENLGVCTDLYQAGPK